MKIDVIVYTDGIQQEIFDEVIDKINSANSKNNDKSEIIISYNSDMNHIPDNKFISNNQYKLLGGNANHGENGHAKISRRILDCTIASNADYLVFVEHDVLIHENYLVDVFDTIKDDKNMIYRNLNYLQLCKYGFQQVTSYQNPLHQMVMNKKYAMDLFKLKNSEALAQGWCYLEPHYPNIIPYPMIFTEGYNLHISHNTNFTNHNSVCYGLPVKQNSNGWDIDLIKKLQL